MGGLSGSSGGGARRANLKQVKLSAKQAAQVAKGTPQKGRLSTTKSMFAMGPNRSGTPQKGGLSTTKAMFAKGTTKP